VVFDYHLLGIGPAYCDIRNVRGSLANSAREAFALTYGPFDERVEPFDRPLAVLYALLVASRRRAIPTWATGLVGKVTNGELESWLRAAVELLSTSP
jgi:hypothetical protein